MESCWKPTIRRLFDEFDYWLKSLLKPSGLDPDGFFCNFAFGVFNAFRLGIRNILIE